MKLVWKILKSNISPWQLFGFAIANLLGISILMMTLQFHHDVYPGLTGENSLVQKDYLIISKQANTVKSMTGNRNQFTEEEINDIKGIEGIADLGEFKASNYDVYGSLDVGKGKKLSTYLFFESVPDRFVDADKFEWNPDAEDTTIPVMIPREYLDLYNFGFSASQNLPQLTEKLIKSLVMDIRLTGEGKTIHLKGQITGFSNYLNTVLVPESFMDWANSNLASHSGNKTARLLVSAKNPTDVEFVKQIESKGYVIAQNKESYSKLTFFLNIATGIILAVGIVISLLSFFILTLSIYLLIEKNHTKINSLELLGYKSSKIAIPYSILIAAIDLLTLGLATVAVLVARHWYAGMLTSIIGIGTGTGYTFAVAGILFAMIAVLHIIVLMITIQKVYRNR